MEEHKGLIPGLPDEIALECLVRVPYCFHSSIKSVCKSWSALLSNRSFYRHRKLSGKGEDLVCLVQATLEPYPARKLGKSPPVYGLTVYNVTEGSWMKLPETPLLPAGIPLFCQCVAVAGKLVLVGGWDPVTLDSLTDVYIYDFIGGGGEWRRGTSMSTARSFFACAAAGGTVYVAGGHDNLKNALRSAEAYDIESDTWRPLPNMSEDRDECQGFITGAGGRRFVVLSGYGTESQGRFVSSAEVFDPDRSKWTRFDGAWPNPNCSPRSSSCLPRRRMIGEMTNLPFHVLWSMEAGSGSQSGVREFDFGSKSWKVVGPMPDGVRSSPCVAVLDAHGSDPGRLFMSGSGYPDEGVEAKNMVYVMEMRSMQWVRVETPAEYSGFVFSACVVPL